MTKQPTRPAPRPTPAWVVGSHIFIVAVFGGATVHAQVPPAAAAPVAFSAAGPAAAPAAAPSVDVDAGQPDAVRLLVGRSTLIDVGRPDRARVADERRHRRRARHVAEPAAGARQGARRHLDVRVEPRRRGAPLRGVGAARPDPAERAGEAAVPDREDRRARQRPQRRAVGHRSSSKDVVDRAINVALGYVEKREDVVTLLQVRAGPASNQVLLQGALRRGEPLGAHRVRHVVLHQPDRHQQHRRPRDDAAVPGAGLHRSGVDEGRAASSAAR